MEKTSEFQINGLYPTKEACFMYTEKDEKTKFDKLEEGSLVKVLMEEEEGYVFVDYFGNKAFVKADKLDKNN